MGPNEEKIVSESQRNSPPPPLVRVKGSHCDIGRQIGEACGEQVRHSIANARMLIDQARFLTLNAAWMMDTAGNKVAKKEIAMIKVVAPNMACQVIDWAIQVHGGGGVSDDFPLAHAYAHARTLRFADGPDEVHRNQIAKYELGRYLEEK